jgi:hypothetical protein
MKKVSVLIGILILAGMAGCSGCSGEGGYGSSAPPSPPEQEPQLAEYSAEKVEFDNKLEELGSLREEIRQATEEWERLSDPATGEPQLSDQRGVKETSILEKCDELNAEAEKLLEAPYPREHAGAGPQVQDLIDFVQETRDKIQAGS